MVSSCLSLCHSDTQILCLCTSISLSQYMGKCGENDRIRNYSIKQYNVPGLMVRAGTTSRLRS